MVEAKHIFMLQAVLNRQQEQKVRRLVGLLLQVIHKVLKPMADLVEGTTLPMGILIPAVPAAVAGMAVPAELPARMRMAPVAVVVRAILTV